MKLTVCMTVNDRPIPVLAKVFTSLRDQPYDELVCVLDRSPDHVAHFVEELAACDSRVKIVSLPGEPGWLSPVTAWNAGFAAVTSQLLYMISSEVIQEPDNIRVAKELLADRRAVVYGKAECSCGPEGVEVNWGGTAPGNLLVDAAHPRPLGFIMALPTADMMAIGGFDPEFAGGYWYDDDDLTYRLWRAGLDFIFTDSISGTHQHHDRPVLDTPVGQAGIARNQALFLAKWGDPQPMARAPKRVYMRPGKTEWRQV